MRAMERDSDAGVRHGSAADAAMDAVLKRLRWLAGRNHFHEPETKPTRICTSTLWLVIPWPFDAAF